jgi:hypothetical protein
MKIKNIRLLHLRNEEHFQFITEVKDLISAVGADALKIAAQYAVFLPRYADEDEALKKIVKSATTADIEANDSVRDTTFRGLADTCKAALNHYDPETAAAARRLQVVFDTYGNVAAKSINAETAAIYNLLQELNGSYAADVNTIGLTGWVTKLAADNSALEALVKARNNENAAKTHLRMKECRAETDNAYHEIVRRINALIVVDGEAAYTVFVNRLNEYIDKYDIHRSPKKPKKTEDN